MSLIFGQLSNNWTKPSSFLLFETPNTILIFSTSGYFWLIYVMTALNPSMLWQTSKTTFSSRFGITSNLHGWETPFIICSISYVNSLFSYWAIYLTISLAISMLSFVNISCFGILVRSTPIRAALSIIDCWLHVGPTTHGTPALITPAFSAAISSLVSPRTSWWSKPILVIDEIISSGLSMILVASSFPPRPHSNTT